jgi:hypothetical protein
MQLSGQSPAAGLLDSRPAWMFIRWPPDRERTLMPARYACGEHRARSLRGPGIIETNEQADCPRFPVTVTHLPVIRC